MTTRKLESAQGQGQTPVCPHCGHSARMPHFPHPGAILRTVAAVVAGVALALILLPLGIMAWKTCANFVSDKSSRSIVFDPLEDRGQY